MVILFIFYEAPRLKILTSICIELTLSTFYILSPKTKWHQFRKSEKLFNMFLYFNEYLYFTNIMVTPIVHSNLNSTRVYTIQNTGTNVHSFKCVVDVHVYAC